MSKRCLHMMEKLSSSEKLYVKSLCICRIVLVCSVFFVCFRFSSGLDEKGKKGRTAADSVQSEWPLWQPKPSSLRAQAQLSETKTETRRL
ncbi:hypothetical protein TNCV_1691231 [Trichonephila clavipes]|nr:hypothetical protein TNCV_1691231 [Trichonephila clavipes]